MGRVLTFDKSTYLHEVGEVISNEISYRNTIWSGMMVQHDHQQLKYGHNRPKLSQQRADQEGS